MKDSFREKTRSLYDISIDNYKPITSKTSKIYCKDGNCYFMKQSNLLTELKYQFLDDQGIGNILYPLKNRRGEFITKNENMSFYVMDYIPFHNSLNEIKAVYLADELNSLHIATGFKRQLSPSTSKEKMKDIYEYLQYKFSSIEVFVRSVEAREFDEYSITILKNYQYILNGKKIMARLQKKIVGDIKDKKSVNYAFIHNNPKLDHLFTLQGDKYLTSIENSKIGVPSLDMAKFYLETEDINVDIKTLIKEYFSKFDDDFYFDYFCFLVLLYYMKSLIIIDKDYVTSQNFIYVAGSIKTFINLFELEKDNE